MHRRLVALAGCAALSCAAGQRSAVVTLSIPAPALQGALLANASEQKALALLPRSYREGGQRYPVVYYLPGFTTDVDEYVAGSPGRDFALVHRRLIASGRTRETIVVIPSGRSALGGSFYSDSPVTGRWQEYLARDVVPYVDAHLRTIPRREARGLAGDSVGGVGALLLAARHPELFTAVYALSPTFLDEHGLSDLGVFSRPEHVRALAWSRERMARWPAAEAPQRLADFARELYAGVAGNPFNYYRGFALAYGAALAPDVSAGPPYFALPCRLEDGRVACDEARLARLAGALGARELAERHADALRKLNGLTFDCGRQDRHGWDLRGTQRLAELLRAAGVPHELFLHDGGHDDRLPEELERRLLPFFSERLAAAEPDAAGVRP